MNRRTVISSLAVLTVILGSLCSCDESPISPNGATPRLSWEAWVNPDIDPYSAYYFTAIWGSSERDVYVVGRKGLVLHYNGRDWERLLVEGVAMLCDIWGSSQDELFVVGSDGAIFHYDGQSWERMESGTSATLYGIWGNSDRDVFAVGSDGTVLRYDGRVWRSIETGTDQTLWDVWGDGRKTFAVGDNGTILELERDEVFEVDAVTTNTLYGIGGCAETGLCAVGGAGTILRYDGSTWSGVRSGTITSLEKVCGTPDGHLIAVGSGTVLHFNGYEWEFMNDVSVGEKVGVWGTSIRNAFVLGRKKIAHYDGSSWIQMELPVPDPGDDWKTLRDIWGSSGSNVYAVGSSEGVLRYDGNDWASIEGGSFDGVWGISGYQVLATRTNRHSDLVWDPINGTRRIEWTVGIVSQFDGTDWTVMNESRNMSFKAIWGVSETDLIVVGSRTEYYRIDQGGGISKIGFKYYPRILHYNGGACSEVYSKETEGSLSDVWGSSETDVYAVGSGGLIVHFNGAVWTEMASGTDAGLIAVWGSSETDIFAVGYDGTIYHCDGSGWEQMESPTAQPLHGIWGGSMDDVFAVGANGTILHYNGRHWKQTASPTEHDLYGIWGSTPDDIFAVGRYGTILHYGYR